MLALVMLVLDYVVLAQTSTAAISSAGRRSRSISAYRWRCSAAAAAHLPRLEGFPRQILAEPPRGCADAAARRPSDIEVLLRGIETGAVKNMKPVAILSPREIDLGQVIRA